MSYPFPTDPAQVWSARDIVAGFCRDGMFDPDMPDATLVCAVILAESGGNPMARGVPGVSTWNGETVRWVDLGMAQLNSHYHATPGVEAFPGMRALTVNEVFTGLTNIDRAFEVIQRSTKAGAVVPNLSAWTAWNNGSWRKHWPQAMNGHRLYREWLTT